MPGVPIHRAKTAMPDDGGAPTVRPFPPPSAGHAGTSFDPRAASSREDIEGEIRFLLRLAALDPYLGRPAGLAVQRLEDRLEALDGYPNPA